MTDNSTDPITEVVPAPLAARAPVRPDSPAFSDFDVNPEIVAALAEVGITKTFAIRELTLPVALAVLLVVLVFRPTGLFGQRRVRRV